MTMADDELLFRGEFREALTVSSFLVPEALSK